MLVSDALAKKGTDVVTTKPETRVVDITHVLRGRGIGAVVIVGAGGAVAGIITERDIVHAIAMHGKHALDLTVRELMTGNIATCRRNHTIDQALQLMVDHACRHLPVVEEGALKGLVSMSDVVKLRLAELQQSAAGGSAPAAEPGDDADGWPVKA